MARRLDPIALRHPRPPLALGVLAVATSVGGLGLLTQRGIAHRRG